ncbi:MAG: baseplate J/gp47 family protein [Pseudobdellovibrionaceae bacterium]
MAFNPKSRAQLYAEASAQVLAFAPITSSELGEVVDNVIFATTDQTYEAYVEMTNSLARLNLDSTTGSDLDLVASEYPDLEPRFQATQATGTAVIRDPAITKIATSIAPGGANQGNPYLNIVDASALPDSGSVLVGERGSQVFEIFNYDSKSGNQLISSTDTIDFDHGSTEPVVKTTVGDRVFTQTLTVTTEATPTSPAKTYTSQGSLYIYDGEQEGSVGIVADASGPEGNTPSKTIKRFIGNPPFSLAEVSNPAPLDNGLAREKDGDLRARIRAERQALSSANIDAVNAVLFKASYKGQKVKFTQLIEEPEPYLPSLAYVDDGSGLIATFRQWDQPIILVDVAVGGERRFFIPSDYRPMVTTDAENEAYVFGNITVKLNGAALTQGKDPGQYRVHPDRGIIRLNTPLNPGDHLEITSIRHFTGLVQETSWKAYGKREDRVNYKGILALGSWLQVRTPATQFVSVQGNLILDGSRSVTDVVNEIKQNMLSYVNNLGIGNTVVKNRLVALGFVKGVKGFTLQSPIADVIIPDGTLARSTVDNITIS